MATKPQKPAADQEGEISVSIVQFKMKGSDTSLQKGLETIKAAFVQAGFTPPLVHESRQLRSAPARQLNGNAQDAEPEAVEEAQAADSPEVEDAIEVTAPAASRRPSAPRKAPNFKVIKDLKFDDVKPTLAEFVAEKKPGSTLDKYLCIAYWFKHHKGVENLTTEHFFTAFMTYQWTLPAHAATPINDLRHQKRQWMAVGEPGTSTITNAGERRVMEMGKAAEA